METNRQLDLDTIWGLSWEQSKKYAFYFIALNIVVGMCSQLASAIGDTNSLVLLLSDPNLMNNPDLLDRVLTEALLRMWPTLALGFVVGGLLSAYFNIAIYRLLIDGVRRLKLNLTDRIKYAYTSFPNYVVSMLVTGVIVAVGTVFCILPGIWLGIRLMFVPIIAANKPELDLLDSITESWRLTRGHFWKLLGYGIVAILINIVGLICCCVGVLFTQVITEFMVANIYYTLSGGYDEDATYEETSVNED